MGDQKGYFTGVVILFAAITIVALIAGAPAKVWMLIGLLWFLYWLVRGKAGNKKVEQKSNKTVVSPPPVPVNQSPKVIANVSVGTSAVYEPVDIDVSVKKALQKSYSIPSPPAEIKMAARWLPQGESIVVAGVRISGGMIYVGSGLRSPSGGIEPALIDPVKNVLRNKGDFTERLLSYWSNYADISAEARRAYLLWLADGKKHPKADIGYVFLYFYGLERRAIYDAHQDVVVAADKPAIAAEVRRLIGIYGDQPNSFSSYAHQLLQFIELSEAKEKLYLRPLPALEHSYQVPYPLRLALGQAAVDGIGVPVHLALDWIEHEPTITKRTPITRCSEEFKKLFELKYRKKYGEGMKLTVNRTKLKISYTPASAGLRNFAESLVLPFGEIPDVTALTGPPKKLQAIVDECATELDAYSRFLGRSPEKRASLEAALLLPTVLWVDSMLSALSQLKERVVADTQTMSLSELGEIFRSAEALNRERLVSLAKALEAEHICIEPDVLAGAKLPKPDDKLVLFYSAPTPPDTRDTAAYKSALVTLELAAGVASADGDFSDAELRHINENIDKWQHLSVPSQLRLKARARLLMVAPVSLATLKKKIEPLDSSAKEVIASFASTLAQVDGKVSLDEIKFLEKVYKLLDVDPKRVYSDVHQAVTSEITQEAKVASSGTAFKLDSARIAALQADSAQVAALLSNIFVEDDPIVVPVAEAKNNDDVQPIVGILGLDEAHSAFARLLMSRPSWARDELNNVALDLDLMVDGALERVNEAALDMFDIPFAEGDDPVEVNTQIHEKVMQ